MEALADWRKAAEFNATERAALDYIEAARNCAVTDSIFEALRSQLSEEEVTELTLVCGYWGMVACILLALKIDLEPSSQKYLPA
jgi:alkylhydroperoxidase family enzyme